MSESGRNKEELSEGLSYKASGASATSIATRASGAELIRQLSYHKLNNYYYQSDETLNQFAGTTANKRKSTGTGASSAIVKRFSDNQYDYQYGKGQHRPSTTGGAAARPRLLRQSTTTNSESVQGTSSSSSTMAVGGGGHNAHNRRRQLAETREQRSWRSCDVAHHDVTVSALSGTHLLGGSGGVRARNNSVGRSDDITTTSITPSFLDLSSSINSMNQQSAKPSPVGSHQGQLHVNNEEEDECDDDDDDDAFVFVVQQQQDQVRYIKGGIGQGADQSDEEYRVVLPPLGMGTRSLTARKNNTNTQNLVLSPQLVNAAALKTTTTPKNRKKIIDREEGSGTSNNKKRKKTVRRSSAPSDAASGVPKPPTSVKVAAVSAITAVAVVAVGVADKTSYPSSDESNNPRRRARGIVILTSVFLLFTCLFMVGITLRLAPLIDDLGKINSNETKYKTGVKTMIAFR